MKKKLVQVAIALAVLAVISPFTYETPLHTGLVFVPLFIGVMYVVALVQHRLDHRARR